MEAQGAPGLVRGHRREARDGRDELQQGGAATDAVALEALRKELGRDGLVQDVGEIPSEHRQKRLVRDVFQRSPCDGLRGAAKSKLAKTFSTKPRGCCGPQEGAQRMSAGRGEMTKSRIRPKGRGTKACHGVKDVPQIR